MVCGCLSVVIFQSTPSAWRETGATPERSTNSTISIHSLRMEGDQTTDAAAAARRDFNPLPPHGGRRMRQRIMQQLLKFQSTPSAWRETCLTACTWQKNQISIHSLRMEGDVYKGGDTVSINISIHSLRMEGDLSPSGSWYAENIISIHSLRMEGDSKTAQESVFHFAYPCTILQKRMQKTTFCTRKNGFFRKKGEKFGAKPSASFCAPMIRTDTFPLNFSHRISGSSMSMVSFAPICSTFD